MLSSRNFPFLTLFSLFYWDGVSAGNGTSHTLQLNTVITPTTAFTISELDNEQFLSYCGTNMTNITQPMCKNKGPDHRADYSNGIQDWIWQEHGNQRALRSKIMDHFNHTEGHHTLNMVCKCELKDDVHQTGSITFSYDGKYLMSLNFTNGHWTTADDEAKRFLNEWDSAASEAKHWKHYLNNDCIQILNTLLKRKANCSLRYIIETANEFWELDCEPLQTPCSNIMEKIPKTELPTKPDFDCWIYMVIAAVIIIIIVFGVTVCVCKRVRVFISGAVKCAMTSVREMKENEDPLLRHLKNIELDIIYNK